MGRRGLPAGYSYRNRVVPGLPFDDWIDCEAPEGKCQESLPWTGKDVVDVSLLESNL